MGFLIGSILGYKFGGLPGLFLGAFLGQYIERQIAGKSGLGGFGGAQGGASDHKKQTQESFFNALFLTMGKLAKIDGQVSTSEIERTEGIIRHMKLNAELRQRAIHLFNQGKDSRGNQEIESALKQFGQLARRSLSLKQIFLEMLVDVAEADGTISLDEQTLIERVCDLIGYPKQMFYALLKMRGFATGGHQQQSGGHSGNRSGGQRTVNRNAPFNPYQVLGVEQSDSKPVIRKAYKRLMSQHHPDKLVSKGLPPEMMKVAEEKAKQVQLAWEKVKDLKGW